MINVGNGSLVEILDVDYKEDGKLELECKLIELSEEDKETPEDTLFLEAADKFRQYLIEILEEELND